VSDAPTNGWNEWSRHVLKELERLDANDKEILAELKRLAIDVATLKVKYGLIGGFIGMIPGVIALIKVFA